MCSVQFFFGSPWPLPETVWWNLQYFHRWLFHHAPRFSTQAAFEWNMGQARLAEQSRLSDSILWKLVCRDSFEKDDCTQQYQKRAVFFRSVSERREFEVSYLVWSLGFVFVQARMKGRTRSFFCSTWSRCLSGSLEEVTTVPRKVATWKRWLLAVRAAGTCPRINQRIILWMRTQNAAVFDICVVLAVWDVWKAKHGAKVVLD